MLNTLSPSILYLQDGTCYKGWSFFRLLAHSGEIVFNTGMTGYQEILTDPSYTGQMVVFTYPEIGNTGLNTQDSESTLVHVQALIAKNIASVSSNWRSSLSLKNFLILKRLPHIFGIDTRALAKHIRSQGVMNAVLIYNNPNLNVNSLKFRDINNINFANTVTTKRIYYICQSAVNIMVNSYSSFKYINLSSTLKTYRIVIIDFGVKLNILRKLLNIGCIIFVVPANCSYETILRYKPDGLLLSNGPGNPSVAQYAIDIIKKMVCFSNIPIFGICMGHQLLNLAIGAKTFKLKFGHRGFNHPTGSLQYSEITSQNHGFAVSQDSLLTSDVLNLFKCSSLNLNDLTVSSTLHKNMPIFSVQYHPEACPGPSDSDYLFKIFIQLIDLNMIAN
uniref:Carbamoyl phosphate synthase small chain n=1 Tax=Osmundea sinicola TaxID=290685 RepID=A0A7L4WNG5_9FLOR|nr:carbamoyl phosphate synthase small subunit [Osmundea sinicola]QFR99805.1 carbamoyl phosphate synthase small subunit [Osmundea sinicola]